MPDGSQLLQPKAFGRNPWKNNKTNRSPGGASHLLFF